jgi:hypothetical protein
MNSPVDPHPTKQQPLFSRFSFKRRKRRITFRTLNSITAHTRSLFPLIFPKQKNTKIFLWVDSYQLPYGQTGMLACWKKKALQND